MANRKLHPAVEVSATGKREYKGRTYALLRTALYFGLAHRWSVVLAMLALLGLSIFGYGYMRQGFFPDMVYDQLYMEYKLPEGNNSTRVARDLREIESYLKTRKEITHVTASVGGTPGRYNLVRSIANPSLSYGELIIDFTSPDDLVENMDEIQEYLTRRYPDAYINLKRYNLMFKKYPIEAQFMGPDPAVLHRLADSARYIMEHTPEVRLITTDWEPQIPVLSIEYDQAAARALGLSRNDVSMSLLSAKRRHTHRVLLRRHPPRQHLPEMSGRGRKADRRPRQYAGILRPALAERTAERGNHGETEGRYAEQGRTGGKPHGKHPAETNQQAHRHPLGRPRRTTL